MAGVYSVSQVNAYIKNMFSQDFALSRIFVKGEVSNCKYHTSGHIYFTLKDGLGAMQAVMFAGRRKGLSFRLEEGQQVVVKGSIEVYERDGRYQIYANEITLDGAGDLFRRFEKLRNELEEMGMFSPEYKLPIPKYAATVGIVTASTGAAIRDIINIAGRRNPYVQLILCPALVQGAGAAPSIVRAIQILDAMNLDVLIVGRGGGSIEDLWAFNEESVARAIFACHTPVISAVGHETDVTIADYVADLRAPTPSAAAELAVFDYHLFEQQCLTMMQQMTNRMDQKMEQYNSRLEKFRLKLKVHSPESKLDERRQYLEDARLRMSHQMEKRISDLRHRLELLCSRMDGLSPLKKISGGYGFITDESGKRVETVEGLKTGDTLTIRLPDGRVNAEIRQICAEKLPVSR